MARRLAPDRAGRDGRHLRGPTEIPGERRGDGSTRRPPEMASGSLRELDQCGSKFIQMGTLLTDAADLLSFREHPNGSIGTVALVDFVG